ncbi:hypothetical protein E2C01_090232 [Portunus trituberculatus]|uniref:Uncharacterized protein n=1 Tax=Portunus trituberculatus TaxID=210409 RepID=A0A5B7JPL4_PORTR|nr:hypothetical protein [Portunus trituberculatus]
MRKQLQENHNRDLEHRFSLGNGLCEEYYRTGCLHDKLLLVRVPLLPLCCPTSHFSRYKVLCSGCVGVRVRFDVCVC